MNHFTYKEGELFCEDVSLASIAKEHQTPAYVYSKKTFERHYRVFSEGLSAFDHLICYSVKANSNIAILNLLGKLGAGADIVSVGELRRARKAGIPAERIVFSGVGKTRDEMRAALEEDILCFNVESLAELQALSQVATEMGTVARVSLRINPDVDAKTHPYISTGLRSNKFGIPWEEAHAAYERARDLDGVEVTGVDCHIGSQLKETAPFVEAATKLCTLIAQLEEKGHSFHHIDIGGGLGIPYSEPGEGQPPSPKLYGEAMAQALAPIRDRGIRLLCEPGRVIAGNAGVLLVEVLYRKRSGNKQFVIIDGALNDLMRPALYDAYHPIRPVLEGNVETEVVDVVGPICESADFFAKERELPKVEEGELLVIGSAGAYGFTMASNYNSRPRSCEILVDGDEVHLIRAREKVEELFALESIPSGD